MKKTQFKRPRNLVPSPKSVSTSAVVIEQLEQFKEEKPETLAELKQKQLEQADRYQKLVEELQANIAEQEQMLKSILGELSVNNRFFVKNWHTAWKWISTWAFGLIAYVSVAGIPPEVLALVPEASQAKVTAVLALLGFIGRFINQSRGK